MHTGYTAKGKPIIMWKVGNQCKSCHTKQRAIFTLTALGFLSKTIPSSDIMTGKVYATYSGCSRSILVALWDTYIHVHWLERLNTRVVL